MDQWNIIGQNWNIGLVVNGLSNSERVGSPTSTTVPYRTNMSHVAASPSLGLASCAWHLRTRILLHLIATFHGYVLWSWAWYGVATWELGGPLEFLPTLFRARLQFWLFGEVTMLQPFLHHLIIFLIVRKPKSWTSSEVLWAVSLTGHSWKTASSVLGSVVWVRHCYWPHSRNHVDSKLSRIEVQTLGTECKFPIWFFYLN